MSTSPTLRWGVVAAAIVTGAVAGAAWPAWRSTRLEPALALRYE